MYYEDLKFWACIFCISILALIGNGLLDYRLKCLNNREFDIKPTQPLISKKDLYRLSDSKFKYWCAYILKLNGYVITDISPVRRFGMGCDIYCQLNNVTYYVGCEKLGLKPEFRDEDDYCSLGRPWVQQFVGIMHHNHIRNGIIITTGYFSNEALEYIKSLGGRYNIELIDGDALSFKYWEAEENNNLIEVV